MKLRSCTGCQEALEVDAFSEALGILKRLCAKLSTKAQKFHIAGLVEDANELFTKENLTKYPIMAAQERSQLR